MTIYFFLNEWSAYLIRQWRKWRQVSGNLLYKMSEWVSERENDAADVNEWEEEREREKLNLNINDYFY